MKIATRVLILGLLLASMLWQATPPARAGSTAGTVSFYTSPAGAEVYLDGVRLGLTPLKLWTVQAGVHSVRYSKAGFRPVSFNFRIKAGQTLPISRTLRH